MDREMTKEEILLFILWISVTGDLLFTYAFSTEELVYFARSHPLTAGLGLIWTTFSAIATLAATARYVLDLYKQDKTVSP